MGGVKRRPWNHPNWVAPQGGPQQVDVAFVKLMPDYGCDLPLWHVEWWELSLSTPLLNDLADWQDVFDASFHETKGWSSTRVAEAWAGNAEDLAARLRLELPGRFHLEVDLWPLDPVT
jgi:hypothetical protein